MMDERVLLVEDDPSIRETTALGLKGAGFDVTTESDGRQALIRFRRSPFEVLVIDIMLPSLDGLAICREVRRDSHVPIVMLTAKTETADIVAGLELGADDYITKPFDITELIARIRAALRRSTHAETTTPVIRIGDLEIDSGSFKVHKQGAEITMTATDFQLLLELARHAGQVLTRDVLLNRVWNYDYLGDSRLVDMAIKRLRAKVEDDPRNPRMITTVRGIGYRLERV